MLVMLTPDCKDVSMILTFCVLVGLACCQLLACTPPAPPTPLTKWHSHCAPTRYQVSLRYYSYHPCCPYCRRYSIPSTQRCDQQARPAHHPLLSPPMPRYWLGYGHRAKAGMGVVWGCSRGRRGMQGHQAQVPS